jgi:hypothetical protein
MDSRFQFVFPPREHLVLLLANPESIDRFANQRLSFGKLPPNGGQIIGRQ